MEGPKSRGLQTHNRSSMLFREYAHKWRSAEIRDPRWSYSPCCWEKLSALANRRFSQTWSWNRLTKICYCCCCFRLSISTHENPWRTTQLARWSSTTEWVLVLTSVLVTGSCGWWRTRRVLRASRVTDRVGRRTRLVFFLWTYQAICISKTCTFE